MTYFSILFYSQDQVKSAVSNGSLGDNLAGIKKLGQYSTGWMCCRNTF